MRTRSYWSCSVLCRSVCLSVCLSVDHDRASCKTAEPIEMPYAVWTQVGLWNHAWDWEPNLLTGHLGIMLGHTKICPRSISSAPFDRGQQGCDLWPPVYCSKLRVILWSPCPSASVCLFASISPKLHVQFSPNFVDMLPVTGAVMCCVLPVLWMTSYFPIVGPMEVCWHRCSVVRRLTPLLLGVGCVLT